MAEKNKETQATLEAPAPREPIIARPDYLAVMAKMPDAVKTVEKAQNNWFRIEGWLWIALLAVLLIYFDVPRRCLHGNVNQTMLKILVGISAFLISFIVAEGLWVKCTSEGFVERVSYFTAVLVFLVPILWVVILFKEFKWVCFGLAFTLMMVVIMWPHTVSVFPMLLEKLSDRKAIRASQAAQKPKSE